MGNQTYTVITFSPVQDFIVKSRKLRDLYGSSYILSLLSWVICQAAEKLKQDAVVSPALINITQGMPNQIILKGDFSQADIKQIETFFDEVWALVANSCHEWVKNNTWQPDGSKWEFDWDRNWGLWKKHAWEFFSAQGNSITEARERINQVKHKRDWTGINWQGESSTLSGADAIAYPGLGKIPVSAKKVMILTLSLLLESRLYSFALLLLQIWEIGHYQYNYKEETRKIQDFYSNLSHVLEESFIDEREQLSIPELIKRLVTNQSVIKIIDLKLRDYPLDLKSSKVTELANDLSLKSFKDLNRHENEDWTGWFQGDGDGAGKYFKSLTKLEEKEEEELTNKFSEEMRNWGRKLMEEQRKKLDGKGRIIYAGGDDFLGVLYEEKKKIQPLDCLQLFYTFKSEIWHWPEEKKITPSVGFVWAGSQVPQRDILQHCHEAEKSAKGSGRDRIAFRILFNSGNHLEWVCPWWVLDEKEVDFFHNKINAIKAKIKSESEVEFENFEAELKKLLPKFPTSEKNLINSYKNRSSDDKWTHFYKDVALLESRHAFDGERIIIDRKPVNNPQIDIASRLIEIYFGEEWYNIIYNHNNWWNIYYDYEEKRLTLSEFYKDKEQQPLQIFSGILGSIKNKKFYPGLDDDELEKVIGNYQNVIGKSEIEVKKSFNDWVINLAKVGFRLTEDKKE